MVNSMKNVILLFSVVISLILTTNIVLGDDSDDLFNELGQEYDSLKPAPYSSVNPDYKIQQIAVGVLYMNKSVGLLFKQNMEVTKIYEEMLVRQDELIKQNRQIIKLLTEIAKKDKPEEEGAVPQGEGVVAPE